MRRLMLALAVAMAVLSPVTAYAQDVSYADSFASGIGSWGSTQEERSSDSSVNEIEFEGGLRAAPAETTNEAVTAVNGWLGGLSIKWGSNAATAPAEWYKIVRNILGLFVATAIGIVFLWWGVRKGIRVLFSSFRSGRTSV